MALNQESASNWPAEESHDFVSEMERPWPSAADDERWAKLPVPVQASYVRQSQLAQGAVMDGLTRA